MDEAPPPQARKTQKSDWRAELSEDDWKQEPSLTPTAPREEAPELMDVEATLGAWKRFLVELSTADKIAFFASLGTWLACFFPWRQSASEGEVLGFASRGLAVLLLASASCAALVLRARGLRPTRIPVLALWSAQLGGMGFAVLLALIDLVVSIDTTVVRAPIGNAEVWASSPSFGVFFAIASGGLSVLGTLLGLRTAKL